MDKRIYKHPILPIPEKEKVCFYWNGEKMFGYKDEMVSSALFANGIKIFGHHARDNSAQGIFCANGQCAQCTVIINGKALKACMTPLKDNMHINSCEGLPELPEVNSKPILGEIETIKTSVLIIGGGPSGLAAAIELAKYGIDILIVDDKDKLGGKLVLQTHKFFGSIEDCYAGTRGIDIAKKLEDEVKQFKNVKVMLNTYALAVYSDKKVGIYQNDKYFLVEMNQLIVATGAREKTLAFSGNTLPGVYGAGAFQTLVNRDLVKPTDKLFIVGGGNVGLIAGYHAIQAGIKVIGLVEAMEKCGGYKVHEDKLKRLGVPIYTSHTVLSANGKEKVESITIAEIDKNFKPIKGTEKTFEVDTILIAVGLIPINIFLEKAKKYQIDVYGAGDALEIAEASSAIFSGKIAAKMAAKNAGLTNEDIPKEWILKGEILKSHPGKIYEINTSKEDKGVFPIIHCKQEIPCNPCTTVCPKNSIIIKDNNLMGIPEFDGECIGCEKCVLICPGLAITLVDFRKDADNPIVTLPYEIGNYNIKEGEILDLVDIDGNFLLKSEIIKIKKGKDKTQLVQVKVSKEFAKKVAGFKYQKEEIKLENLIFSDAPDDIIICRCERVTLGEIRKAINEGVTDLNELKAITRAGMGACGGSCESLILSQYKQMGIKEDQITLGTKRPIFVEVPLGTFANTEGGE